jgi:Serine/threonine protein kinase
MEEIGLSEVEKNIIKEDIYHEEALRLREKRTAVTIFDFEPLSIIGRGAFGEVRIVRYRQSNQVFAMKKVKKSEMIRKNQVQHVKSERNVLALAENP